MYDTKNFRVNTGVRTFDAVSHLRRCGADPEVVHYLFRTDYETNLAECTAIANSVFYPEGLVVAVCPDNANSIQAISGKIADDLLGIENVRVSIVFFRLKDNVIGVSARSTGEINVQVIMEQFGGGGHQNVAGSQVKNRPLKELKQDVVNTTLSYMKEADKMKVIMLQDLKKVGKKGDIVEVAEGYGRNFLIAKKYAVEATKQNINVAQAQKKSAERKKQQASDEARLMASQLSQVEITIPVRVGEGSRLFGSVTSKDVALTLKEKHNIDIDKRKIDIKNITCLGDYTATIKVHPEITSTITVHVVEK